MSKKYAIVEVNGRQEMVSEGDIVSVFGEVEGETYTFTKVLAVYDGGLKWGYPILEKASVEAKVIGDKLTPKIRVAKFKAKSKYHRVVGHRQTYKAVKIASISLN